MGSKLDIKIQTHFDTRTVGKNGCLKDYIIRPAPNEDTINVGDNDYLNISAAPNVIDKQVYSLKQSKGEVVMSTVFVVEDVFSRAEKEFARMVGTESCMITQSGYASNSGLLQSICDKKTHVYADEKIHASFWDGILIKRPKTHIFSHNNVGHLESKIKEHGPGIIIVESLYSVNGDLCPLEKVLDLRDKYKCIIIVDESHTLGTYGENGRGISYQFCENGREVDFITASLAKAFCTRGGIIAGKTKRIDFVREISMINTFSSSILINEVVRLNAFIDLIAAADKKREDLHRNSEKFYKGVVKLGYKVHSPHPSPIISIVFDNEDEMDHFNKFVLSKNIQPAAFMYPATPLNEPVVRFTLHSDNDSSKIERILQVLDQYKMMQKLNNKNISCINSKL